jgi:hypothetical protein
MHLVGAFLLQGVDSTPVGVIGQGHVTASNTQHFDALRRIAHPLRSTQTLFSLLSVLAHGSTHP